MFCKNCGTECSNSAFCPNCGTKVEEITQVPPESTMEIENPGKGKGIASMILGIASLVLVLGGSCPFFFPFALASAIVSAVLSRVSLNASAEAGFTNGPAKAGKILSLIGIITASVCGFLLIVYSAVMIILEFDNFY